MKVMGNQTMKKNNLTSLNVYLQNMGRFSALPTQSELAEMKEDLAFKEGEMKKSEYTALGLASGKSHTSEDSIKGIVYKEKKKKKDFKIPFTNIKILPFWSYHDYPEYFDILTFYQTGLKILITPNDYLLMCPKYCRMNGKQCSPWSDAAFCSIWSGSTLFAQACLSEYLGNILVLCSRKWETSRRSSESGTVRR